MSEHVTRTSVYPLNQSPFPWSLKLPHMLLPLGKRMHKHIDLQDWSTILGIMN